MKKEKTEKKVEKWVRKRTMSTKMLRKAKQRKGKPAKEDGKVVKAEEKLRKGRDSHKVEKRECR